MAVPNFVKTLHQLPLLEAGQREQLAALQQQFSGNGAPTC
jgi:hypothetical protein